jgi:type VI secretion system protein
MFMKTMSLAVGAVCLVLAGCVSATTRYAMRVHVAEDANLRTPVPVDLVFVWDKAVAGQLASTTARDWFASKKFEFRQDDPNERKLTVCEWEWVPGQNVADINLAVPAAARRWSHGVFVFADYRNPGAHRSRLTPGSETVLELGREELSVRTVGRTSEQAFEWLDDACQPSQSAARSAK